jgi:elongation factor P
MISTADFRNGMVVIQDGELMEIVEFQHVKPGKGGAFVRTRFRNVLTGRVIDKTFRAGEKMEEARLEEERYQYLYHDGDVYHFMHCDNFEELALDEAVVAANKDWMKENDPVTLVFHKGKAISFRLPIFVKLRIVRSDPGIQGDRASGGTKPATLETGATIQVPLFVSEGDVVKVDTRTGAYIERVA